LLLAKFLFYFIEGSGDNNNKTIANNEVSEANEETAKERKRGVRVCVRVSVCLCVCVVSVLWRVSGSALSLLQEIQPSSPISVRVFLFIVE
jgi:hypothetical protein